MVCKTCGVDNNPDSKFCTNCGEKLTRASNIVSNICSVCCAQNELKNKFCISSCGNKLQNKIQTASHHQTKNNNKKAAHEEGDSSNNRNRKPGKKKLSGVSIFWIAAGTVIAVVLVITTFIPDTNIKF